VGVACVQGKLDRSGDAIAVAEHIVVPEADHAVALGLDSRCSSGVGRTAMLAAVNLHHQTRSVAAKIHNVGQERGLKAESCLGKAAAKEAQHSALSVRGVSPQAA
jgi:hypothetical protein